MRYTQVRDMLDQVRDFHGSWRSTIIKFPNLLIGNVSSCYLTI